jgi:hypothetical protein
MNGEAESGAQYDGSSGLATPQRYRRERATEAASRSPATYSEGNMRLVAQGNLRSREAAEGGRWGDGRSAQSVGPSRDTLCETVMIAVPRVEEVSVIWQNRY